MRPSYTSPELRIRTLILVEAESPEAPVQNVHNASPIIKHCLRNYDLLNDVLKTMIFPSGSYLYSRYFIETVHVLQTSSSQHLNRLQVENTSAQTWFLLEYQFLDLLKARVIQLGQCEQQFLGMSTLEYILKWHIVAQFTWEMIWRRVYRPTYPSE